jgi:uncharacterized tellurite resistance protein B-like protein
MTFRRLLGLSDTREPRKSGSAEPETATIRRIVAELEQLEPEQRRYLAGFAYVLGRAANADLEITSDEMALMERIVSEVGGLPEAQAVLVVQIAKHQAELYGGTEDYLVTRDFSAHATPEQRRALVKACFAVVASDHAITSEEYAELTEIASELDLGKDELNRIRADYADQLTAIQRMRGER